MTVGKQKKVDEYALLRDLILHEKVLPNERLVEMEYAERFGTNRSNIRKALARLEQDGLVVCEPFRGAHVRRITETEAVEMFEVRAALEVMLVQYAAERATESDKKRVRASLQKMQDMLKAKDAMPIVLASRDVRRELWRISRHATGEQFLSGLNTQLVRIWFRGFTMPGRAEAIVAELTAVVDAVCDGSGIKASRAMRRYHDSAIANLNYAIKVKNKTSASGLT